MLDRGVSVEELSAITGIDPWFLAKLNNLVRLEEELRAQGLTPALYRSAKLAGYPDHVLEEITRQQVTEPLAAVFKMVDTCGGEFAAVTPYFYATYDEENEAATASRAAKTVIVLGSGPIRIGQGIEFDYASVHCVHSLQKAGYDVVIVNNNPETVSTDFDTADRLYFEPLTPEDVLNIIRVERPWGVVVAFGGQTAIKLTHFLSELGVRILGTTAASIDEAEDRSRFEALLERLHLKRPAGFTVTDLEGALAAVDKLGFPVLLRPSYVLGGQNMIIAFSVADVREYMGIILALNPDKPVLIDQYLPGVEVEVDAICDGEDILIPGIMEHIERAGVHSGDSIAVYPPWNLRDEMGALIEKTTRELALALDTHGLVNIQYVISGGDLYVIEVNPRSSRTIPYLSKVTDIPMVDLAVRAMLGEKLADMGYGTGLAPVGLWVAVKVPVFSFEKLSNVDTQLGPEMKSTGEVLGLAGTLEEALYKGLLGAGYQLKKRGGIFFTVRDADKAETVPIAKKFAGLAFDLYATAGTAAFLEREGLTVTAVGKIHEVESAGDREGWQSLNLITSGRVDYVVSSTTQKPGAERDSLRIRRKAVEHGIPCLTSLDTANALADCLLSNYSAFSVELVDLNQRRQERLLLPFTKMQSCSNDYLFFDGRETEILNPEGLSVRLSDRRRGIGCDGVVTIAPSACADAKMMMYNADGSEGKMSGNGLCCVGKYLYDKQKAATGAAPMAMTVETSSGVHSLTLHTQNGEVRYAGVEMGQAVIEPLHSLRVGGHDYQITCLSLGNLHCVLLDRQNDFKHLDDLPLENIGPLFEYHEAFPERINTEFVQIIDENTLRMRVWERGSGETWACGTGACAAAVAAVENGFCRADSEITVRLKGGEVRVRYSAGEVYMLGSAERAFDGFVEV
jgi:carbamoyl-phosphate synthase large subunit